MKADFHRLLGENGWKWRHYYDDPIIQMDNTDDYFVYTLEILGEYRTTVRAVVAECEKHLHVDGHFGVLWIDAAMYECDPPYSERDLNDMIFAIEKAEENLLRIGMPFTPDYRFHGNRANRQRRNEKLRKLYNLEEKEREEK